MHENRHKYQKITVLGAAESGCGAALLAQKMGKEVFVSDFGKIKPEFQDLLAQHDIPFEMGTHSLDKILKSDLIIKSPGIPETAPVIKQLREAGIYIVSELEFASWFSNAKLICITGSNGKTTTTSLIGHILKQAGLDVCVAGNIGQSFARQLFEKDHDYFVLEISSFQLDDMYDFKADIAVLLNITPDHLDRYEGSFEKYAASKMRIIQNQTDKDVFIFNVDDKGTLDALKKVRQEAKQYKFSLEKTDLGQGAWLQGNKIIISINNNIFDMTLEQLALQGRHNISNSMAAGIAANLLQIRKESLKQSFSDFVNVEHRLEFVANVHGVTYINDSKATNVNATWYALESFHKPIVWIVGGKDKGNEYADLRPLVKEKVKAMICLGVDNLKLHGAFGDLVNTVVDVSSAADAVYEASLLAKKGDIVLLSPACASFDLFENYEDRGNQFKMAVKSL